MENGNDHDGSSNVKDWTIDDFADMGRDLRDFLSFQEDLDMLLRNDPEAKGGEERIPVLKSILVEQSRDLARRALELLEIESLRKKPLLNELDIKYLPLGQLTLHARGELRYYLNDLLLRAGRMAYY